MQEHHKELVRKLSGTDRWRVYRLVKLGFTFVGGHEDPHTGRIVVWLQLEPEGRRWGYDACNLAITIGDGSINELRFRPRRQSSVHVLKYLNLGVKAQWAELDSFIEFYNKHFDSLYEEKGR